MTMKATLARLVSVSILAAHAAPAEESANAPFGPSPSLEETMHLLQEALPSKVNYTVYGHDINAGTNTQVKRSFELSVTAADPDRCSIGVRFRFDNGKTGRVSDKSAEIDLKEVEQVTLRPLVEVVQEVDDGQGHPEHRVKIQPPIFLLSVTTSSDVVMFNFYDEAAAQRATKAVQHAVELCGGGS
jgi:hypothetical protein